MRAAARAVCVALALSGAAGETCPSTGAGVTTHASCQLGVQFSQACSQVRSEITSRLLAFRAGHWVDPHNGGTYNLTSSASATMLQASRVTGAHCPGCYTDKMDFTLTATEDEGCELLACSVSQSSSMYDESTNYCNLRNLYCNSQDGCPVVVHELHYSESKSNCANCRLSNCDEKSCLAPALVKQARSLVAAAKASAPTINCADTTTINSACPSAAGVLRPHGMPRVPSTCSAACARAFLPWIQLCGRHLSAGPRQALGKFAEVCKASATPGATPGGVAPLAKGMRRLSSGQVQSWVTFGLWVYGDARAEELVTLALSLGVTSFFCSVLGGNQAGAGKAFAKITAAQRAKLFLIGTVNRCPGYMDANACYAWTKSQGQGNLKLLQQTQLDQLMLDYPPSAGCGKCEFVRAQWRAFEELKAEGAVKSLAVSNYCPNCLDCILSNKSATVPAANQLLFHVGMGSDPSQMIAENTKRGVAVQAYSPLARGSSVLLHGTDTTNIAIAHGKSAAQVSYKWVLQHNVSLCLSSTSKAHFIEDLGLFDFTLSAAEMATLDALSSPGGDPYSSCRSTMPSGSR